jgi:hypothetical protein
MIGAEEKRKLMARMADEPARPLAAVLKCAAGVLVLVIIAAGPWAFVSSGGHTAAPAAGGQAASQPERALPRSVAESKRVFDERRQRLVEASSHTQAEPENGAAVLGQVDSNSDPGFQVTRIQH